MSDTAKSPSPLDRVRDEARILKALRDAVESALRRHALLGNPIAIWRDGRVEWIPPERILDEMALAEQK